MSVKFNFVYIFLVLLGESQCVEEKSYSELNSCDLGPLADEIAGYEALVKNIIQYTVNGPFKGRTYNELAKFVDKFGPRVSGSIVLENSIDYLTEKCQEEFYYDIITEHVKVPYWQRGEEKLTMLELRKMKMNVLGLGYSVSTPPEGITAEVMVMSNFTALEQTPDEKIKGKIVLCDPKFTTYSKTVKYRLEGATRASAKGAIAALVRSITPFSINSPHTGIQTYGDDVVKIPVAAITLEDADMIRRIFNRDDKIVLHLKMNSTYDVDISRNTIIDLNGTDDTDKVVIISAHVDSWDVGQGAMDDGGGVFITWAALAILRQLDLTPKRTIRAIFWTAEEAGYLGAKEYERVHKNETENINFIMESDEGTFAPLGLSVGGKREAKCIIAEVLKLFKSINASRLKEEDAPGSDIGVFTSKGVPGASLYTDDAKYMWFHHSEGDTMNVENPDEPDLGAAFWTAVSYIIADLSVDIPR